MSNIHRLGEEISEGKKKITYLPKCIFSPFFLIMRLKGTFYSSKKTVFKPQPNPAKNRKNRDCHFMRLGRLDSFLESDYMHCCPYILKFLFLTSNINFS